MPALPDECVAAPNAPLVCTFELSSDVIPSIQYKCINGAAEIQSVMVHATDPESGIRAPFKLEPGKGCHDICEYYLGGSGLRVKDIVLSKTSVRLGDSAFIPDEALCQPSQNA
jgi:hypothetical protein